MRLEKFSVILIFIFLILNVCYGAKPNKRQFILELYANHLVSIDFNRKPKNYWLLIDDYGKGFNIDNKINQQKHQQDNSLELDVNLFKAALDPLFLFHSQKSLL